MSKIKEIPKHAYMIYHTNILLCVKLVTNELCPPYWYQMVCVLTLNRVKFWRD